MDGKKALKKHIKLIFYSLLLLILNQSYNNVLTIHEY